MEAQIKKAAKLIKQEKSKFTKSQASTSEQKITKPVSDSEMKKLKEQIDKEKQQQESMAAKHKAELQFYDK